MLTLESNSLTVIISEVICMLSKSNENKFQEISMLKRNNVWVARECIKLARSILGANGITSDYSIMRHMANIESAFSFE